MKLYRLLISDNGGETFHRLHDYETVRQAVTVAGAMHDKDYQVLDIRAGCVVASGRTKPRHTRGVFDYERK